MLLRVSILLAVLASNARAGDAREGVEATIAAMEDASRIGSVDLFMACVDQSEPTFAMEMRHWAEDLLEHPIATFDIAIEDEGAEFVGERAEFRMGWRWTHPEPRGGIPAPSITGAEFPRVVFVQRDGRWLYAGEEWEELAGEGFVVRYLTGDRAVAEVVARVFPTARAHVDAGFEVADTGAQVIKLYQSMDHLKASVYLSMPDPLLGGWNEPGESIKFMSNYGHDERSWTRAFAHEYGHVATWHMGPETKSIPWWIMEGVAELAAEGFDEGRERGNDRMIRRLAAKGGLVDWEKISDYRSAAWEVKPLAYHQGHHMLGYISRRWEREGRNRWLRALASGKSLDEATRAALGVSFEDLDARWRASLAAPADGKGDE